MSRQDVRSLVKELPRQVGFSEVHRLLQRDADSNTLSNGAEEMQDNA